MDYNRKRILEERRRLYKGRYRQFNLVFQMLKKNKDLKIFINKFKRKRKYHDYKFELVWFCLNGYGILNFDCLEQIVNMRQFKHLKERIVL